MTLSQLAYNDLLKYGKSLLKGRDLPISEIDIANETIVRIYDTQNIEEKDVKNIAYKIFSEELSLQYAKIQYNDEIKDYHSFISKEENLVCWKCKQDLPVAAFYVYTSFIGVKSICRICKSCHQKRHKKWYAKNYIKYREYAKQYRKKHPELCRLHKIKSQKKSVQELNDTYLKRLLKHHYKIPEEIINADNTLIENLRQKIENKRKKAGGIKSTSKQRVIKLDKKGNILGIYDSFVEAGLSLGRREFGSCVGNVANGRRKSFRGFIFRKA